jgi:hypothetical protein
MIAHVKVSKQTRDKVNSPVRYAVVTFASTVKPGMGQFLPNSVWMAFIRNDVYPFDDQTNSAQMLCPLRGCRVGN